MKRKPYPAYKLSGVEWLGDVPEHWDIKKIGHATYVKGRIGWQGLTSDEFIDEGSFCVTGTDFVGGKVNWDTCYHVSEERYQEDPYIHLKEGDLLVTKDGTIGKTAVVSDLKGKATLNSGIFLTRPMKSLYNTDFMFWVLNSKVFSEFIEITKTGTTISHLYQNIFVRFTFPVPPSSEQQAIADFLDAETNRIDMLIGKKQRLIELLKEKRTALISRAVTKGLDPTASMKPSGVEWLGDIPEHWDMKKIKYIKEKTPNSFVDGPFGSNLKTEHFVIDGDVFVIESGFATKGKITEEDLKLIETTHFETIKRSSTKADDIIIAKIGAYFGLNNILPPISKPAVVSGNSLKLTVDQSLCSIQFVHFHLLYLKWSGAIDLLANATAQPALSLGDMNCLSFLVPPLREQQAITDFLDAETTKIDTLITKVETAIEKLKEYRTALISAAVTGKIDVRETV